MYLGPLTHTQMLSFKGLSIRLALDRVSVLGVPQMSGAAIIPISRPERHTPYFFYRAAIFRTKRRYINQSNR
jgi:hypothetical protein